MKGERIDDGWESRARRDGIDAERYCASVDGRYLSKKVDGDVSGIDFDVCGSLSEVVKLIDGYSRVSLRHNSEKWLRDGEWRTLLFESCSADDRDATPFLNE